TMRRTSAPVRVEALARHAARVEGRELRRGVRERAALREVIARERDDARAVADRVGRAVVPRLEDALALLRGREARAREDRGEPALERAQRRFAVRVP